MTPPTNRFRRIVVSSALVAGVGLGAAGVASAASGGSTTTTVPASGTARTDPATLTHGPGETLLTGSELTDAVAAAQAAEPGAAVVRAETDSAGSPYEVHMEKADGSYVTVKLDGAFKVTAIQDGFGAGPVGSAPAGMLPPTSTQ
ncbi:MAG: hypothetical protein ACRDV0_02260 [Acidimicrobiales bacterium]